MSEPLKPVKRFGKIIENGEFGIGFFEQPEDDYSVPVVIVPTETYRAMVDALKLAHENHGENPAYRAALDAAGEET